MKVNVAKISGVDDAILSLYFSKRTWTPELSNEIRTRLVDCTCRNGFICQPSDWLDEKLDLLMKYGIDYGHSVLLSFIDITIEVQGLHRAGQDDWDSHAQRFDNRIVRSSTRLGTYYGGEKSSYYQDKVLYPLEALKEAGVELPSSVTKDGEYYFLTEFGFVKAEHVNDQDVIRGLYPLAIPSDNITKVNFRQLRHVYNVRGAHSSANPEVKELAEGIKQELLTKFRPLGKALGQ